MNTSKFLRTSLFTLIGIFVGFVATAHVLAYAEQKEARERDRSPTIFTEAQALLQSNEQLREEIGEMDDLLRKISEGKAKNESLEEEFFKKQALIGTVPVTGDGIEVKFSGKSAEFLELLWFTDFVNELSSAGAQAIAVNGYRITPSRRGFANVEGGRVMLGDTLLIAPYRFSAIGDGEILENALRQEGGILKRLMLIHPEIEISISQKQIELLPLE